MAYYREMAPLIGYYFAKGSLETIDGMAAIDAVAGQIDGILIAPRAEPSRVAGAGPRGLAPPQGEHEEAHSTCKAVGIRRRKSSDDC